MRSIGCLTLGLVLATAACQGNARGRRTMRDDAVRGDVAAAPTDRAGEVRREPARSAPGCIDGTPSIRVIWEALHVERQQVLNPRSGRPGVQGIAGAPDLEVAILNASFAGTKEQNEDNRARARQGGVTRVADQDMLDLLDSIRKAGFYDYAKPTGGIEGLFAGERSRGRVTIEEGGRSVTLLSQRGLGLAEETREIPAIYSEVKRAIQVLRNRSRMLSVTGASVSGHAPARPGDAVEPPATGKSVR